MSTKKIGMLLGDEVDWPSTFEALIRRLNLKIKHGGETHNIVTERVRIHPFKLSQPTTYNLVVDRLAYWNQHPREWLKKAAFLDGLYLVNNPFTFQAMEKHTAYCAMMKLGLNVPETWLIPTKNPPADPTFKKKWETTSKNYNDMFDLPAIAKGMGYPLYMKPFDGGGWRGVSRIPDEQTLMEQYDNSGTSMMHLQKAVEPFDVFVRSLAIGPQVISLHYDPTQPSHGRYQVDHNFLPSEKGVEARQMVKLINSYFRWEFNSCECLLQGDTLWAIDYANACPDIAVNSLHYYYPWALKALVRWCVFCAVTERKFAIATNPAKYWAVAEKKLPYKKAMAEYEKIADEYFETEKFEEFCDKHLGHIDEVVAEYFLSQEFEDMLVATIRSIFPTHEQDHFIGHFRGLVHLWADGEVKRLAKK